MTLEHYGYKNIHPAPFNHKLYTDNLKQQTQVYLLV